MSGPDSKAQQSRGRSGGDTRGPEVEHQEGEDPGFAQVMDNAPHGVLIQRDGEILYANRKCAEMLGYDDAAELTAINDFTKLLWPEDRERLRDIGKAVPLGEALDRYEHRCVTKQGEAVWVETRVRHVEWRRKPAVLMNVTDISERLDTATALSRSESRLREQENRYQKTLNTVNQAIISLDQHARIVEFNIAAEDLFKYEANEVLGQTIHVLMPDDLRYSGLGPLEVFRRGERSPTSSSARRFRGRRKDGVEFPYEMTVRVWRSNNERFMTGVVRDLTIELRTQKAMSEAKQSAEEASRLKSEFLSSMSHELRTPLNAILGFSQLLASDTQDPLNSDHSRFVAQIEKAGGHLLAMINEILDMAKIDAGQMILMSAEVNIGAALGRCIDEMSDGLKAKQVEIVGSEGAAPKLLANCDEARLLQCFRAVLGRLAKLAGEGGEILIEHGIDADEMVRIEARVTGADVTSGELDTVFEVFAGNSTREGETDGAGLGLPIAKRLMDLMNGSLSIVSPNGNDIAFVFRLPVAASCQGNAEDSATGAETRRSVTARPRDATLLYVEDKQTNRFLMLQIVAKLPGIALILAETGETGLELFEKHRPDLVILDIGLPDIDGYEVLKRMRDQSGGSVPILALSANATESDITKGHQAGFDEYLTKPVEVPRLIVAIERALKQGEHG